MERFEDLIAWQKARILTRKVYEISNQGRFSLDLGLKDQIRRSAVSIMSNIAQGYEIGTATEFSQSMGAALGASGEVRSHLYVALDIGYVRQSEIDELLKLGEEISRIITGLRRARLTQ